MQDQTDTTQTRNRHKPTQHRHGTDTTQTQNRHKPTQNRHNTDTEPTQHRHGTDTNRHNTDTEPTQTDTKLTQTNINRQHTNFKWQNIKMGPVIYSKEPTRTYAHYWYHQHANLSITNWRHFLRLHKLKSIFMVYVIFILSIFCAFSFINTWVWVALIF